MQNSKGASPDWSAYVELLSAVHGLELDAERRVEVALQLGRIAAMAETLMDFSLPARIEAAAVFKP